MSGLFWNVSVQDADPERVDAYLASVADQERALGESPGFGGRLVLRSQRYAQRFWVCDAWSDGSSLRTATVTLRTLCSVAGLAAAPRELATVEVPLDGDSTAPLARLRLADAPLPFFLIAENRVKPAGLDDYELAHRRFAAELAGEPGFRQRRLLRALDDPAHHLVVDEWRDERTAFDAFQRRQSALGEVAMTRFLALLTERGEPDFALGIHG